LDGIILRKGAVSAKQGEVLLIPINMREAQPYQEQQKALSKLTHPKRLSLRLNTTTIKTTPKNSKHTEKSTSWPNNSSPNCSE